MDTYLQILYKELRPAMGCTEPAASALAGAKAAELLGCEPSSLQVFTSRDMVKNAMGVGLPNCALKGIQAAVALGAFGGDSERGLSILSTLTSDQIQKASSVRVSLFIDDHVPPLYIRVIAKCDDRQAIAVISGEHDRFSYLEQDGNVLRSLAVDTCGTELEKEDELFLDHVSVEELLGYVEHAPQEALDMVLDAKKTNMAIALYALEHDYGLNVAEAFSLGSALAAAASDARMAGCPLPVIINSGSGNQGITLTVPIAVVGEYLKSSEEKLAKALLLAQLVGLALTARKNRLSALCGAFTAAIGTACGFVYLLDGTLAQMDGAFNTMVGNLTGIICDGAKMTCALKIYSCVEAAAFACKLAVKNLSPDSESGIVGRSSSESMDFLKRISHEGMEQTDKTILSIMLGKQL